jgi:lysophospholipase L1-like esterase
MAWADVLAWLLLLSGLLAWGMHFARKGIWSRLIANKAKANKARWYVETEKQAYYQRQVGAEKMRILMLGDSLTAQGNWALLLGRDDTMNYGIAGETTLDLLERLDEVLATRPEVVCLMIGINDLVNVNAGADGVLRRQVESCKRILDSGAKLLLGNVLPTTFDNSVNGMVQLINAGLAAKAAEIGYYFVDMTEDFATNGSLRAELSYDGLHLNLDGYKIWARHLGLHLPEQIVD